MHVAHLHTGAFWGGGENQILHLLKALPSQGVAPRLFAHAEGELLRRARAEGLDAVPLPSLHPRRAVLRDLFRSPRPDVIHAQDSQGLTLGLRAARITGAPLLLSRRISSPLRRNWFSRLKYSPRRIRRVVAISETVRQTLIRSGFPSDQILVAPSGLDLQTLDPAAPDPALREWGGGLPLLGGLGKLSPKKNWKLLVETAARLRDRGVAARWVVAGEGPEQAALQALIEARGLRDSVRLLGFRQDALAVLRSLDALFFPSLMEGASITVREAMALEIPVIAADAEGTVESLGGFGWIISPKDPDGAAAVVAGVLADPEGTRARAQQARQRARTEFTLARTLEATVRAYHEALA